MDNQSWKIQKSDSNRGLFNVEEILGKDDLVHEELELEKVLACWSSEFLCRHLLVFQNNFI